MENDVRQPVKQEKSKEGQKELYKVEFDRIVEGDTILLQSGEVVVVTRRLKPSKFTDLTLYGENLYATSSDDESIKITREKHHSLVKRGLKPHVLQIRNIEYQKRIHESWKYIQPAIPYIMDKTIGFAIGSDEYFEIQVDEINHLIGQKIDVGMIKALNERLPGLHFRAIAKQRLTISKIRISLDYGEES